MVKLSLPEIPSTPMFLEDGSMHLEWQEFFRGLFIRTGGTDSINIEDIYTLLYFLNESKNYDNDIKRLEQLIYSLPDIKSYNKEIDDLEKKVVAGVYKIDDTVKDKYETIFIPAAAMTSTATNGATYLTYEYETNDINVNFLEFDGATEEYAEFQIPMPEQWNLGTIKAKFFWSSAGGSTAGDTVEWEIQAGAISDGDNIDTALGTAQVVSDTLIANSGTKIQITAATPAITVGGTPALGDMTRFKVSRNVGGTDDMTEDAWLFGCLIQYRKSAIAEAW